MKINQVGTGVNPIPNKGMDAQIQQSEKGAIRQKEPVKSTPQVNKMTEGASAPNGTKSEDFDDEMMKQAMDQANKSLAVYNRYIERAVHEVTHAVMYTIKDTKTDEVIAEFPPRKIQDMIAKMWEIAGLFVDEKA